jgi:hypothetical protein
MGGNLAQKANNVEFAGATCRRHPELVSGSTGRQALSVRSSLGLPDNAGVLVDAETSSA